MASPQPSVNRPESFDFAHGGLIDWHVVKPGSRLLKRLLSGQDIDPMKIHDCVGNMPTLRKSAIT